jgi:hypothetical protein
MKAIMSVEAVSANHARQLVLALGLLVAWSGVAVSQVPSAITPSNVFVNGVRAQDEIVVVNTRALCNSCDPAFIRSSLQVETYALHDEVGHRHWQSSDLNSFVTFDPTVRTIIFVHGNQITPADAKHEGLEVYRRLMWHGADSERIRFVIFSWPSARVGGLLRDVREKAARTGPAGCQLAWLLGQMPAETPVSLIGFSYGARIITGGLHILAGGNLGGYKLTDRTHANRSPMNVVLIASAMHACWLGEGQYHGLAMTQVDQMFFLNSCQDPAMRFYHVSVPGLGGPQAMGLRGPTCLSAWQAAKIHERDVSGATGNRHDLYLYLCAPGTTGQVWSYLAPSAVATGP